MTPVMLLVLRCIALGSLVAYIAVAGLLLSRRGGVAWRIMSAQAVLAAATFGVLTSALMRIDPRALSAVLWLVAAIQCVQMALAFALVAYMLGGGRPADTAGQPAKEGTP